MVEQDEVRFTLRYAGDYGAPDLEPLREVVEIEVTPGVRDDDRSSEFDSSLHSAATAMDVVGWVASGGMGTMVVKALRDVLVEYLKQRNRSVDLTVGKRRISLKGPLSSREVSELIESVLDK